MILIKNADVYAPEHLGIKDVLICGAQIEAVGEVWKEEAAAGS